MAQTYANNDNVLSKVKFGNTTYYLKDAAARAILDTFGNAALEDVALSIADGGSGLVTSDQVYDFVIQQIGGLGEVLNLLSESDHTQVASPASGDFVVESDGKEWLYDGTAWREVGSENAYVVKTFTIAGVDMQDNITKAELQAALELGALAYKDNGSVKVTTIDSMNSFTTGAAGSYNVSSTTVSVPATYSALDVTPAGSVALTAGTAAAASYDKTTSVAISAAAPVDGTSVANYTPAGDVTISSVTVTPSTTSVATVTDAGTAYQLQAGSMSQGADSTDTFATEGVVVSIDSNDSEMLVFTAASTTAAVTASGTVTYVDPVLSGSLPTFGSESVVTGISSASAQASFSGTGTVLSASPSYTATDATVTQPTFTAEFTGTSKTVTPAVATTTSAVGVDASVTVSSETITPAFTSTEKTVSVTFGNNS
jgi:hypothetical protein